MTLDQLLAPFIAMEDNSDAVIVLGDDAAMRVMAAWRRCDNEWEAPEGPMPPIVHGKMGKVWEWICAGWVIDVDEVSRAANLPTRIVHAKLEKLMSGRLIYPTGALAKGAELALTAFTAKQLGIKQQGPAKQRAPRRERERDEDDNSN